MNPHEERFSLSTVTLALLAGGEGTRMGQPKAWLEIDAEPILNYLLRRWNWPGPTMLVTAPGREHPPGWEGFDQEAVDTVPGEGPLRGVLTALTHTTTERLVITSVDMPLIGREQLQWVAEQLHSLPRPMGVLMRRPLDGQIQIEPLPSAFHVEAREIVQKRLESGKRSMAALRDDYGMVVVDAPEEWTEPVWTNLNFPEEFQRFLSKQGK